MSTTLNLSLTDELRAFVDQNSGDGTLYATPSEFVRNVLREKKDVGFIMANGQVVTRSVGFAIVRYDKYFTVDEIVFARSRDPRVLERFDAGRTVLPVLQKLEGCEAGLPADDASRAVLERAVVELITG